MNRERVLALAKRIESIPHGYGGNEPAANILTAFNMRDFHCGSVGCIGGWAVWMARQGGQSFEAFPSYCRAVAEWLDIDVEQAESLCIPNVGIPYDDVLPQDAAKVLRALAETGVVDWRKWEEEII